jgi:predicted homoserine dehydrogenase-like protein
MIYTEVLNRFGRKGIVRAGIIGAGHYAKAVITQSESIPRLLVPVVADLSVDAAREAFRLAGHADEDIITCESRAQALTAIESGKRAVLADALLMMDLPLDVIVEATGSPTAGALHARAAIKAGKHVAMVNKEGDVTVGPILKHLADKAGVVYTQVDGDQHGLLMGLVGWARELGLEIVCGGKARDSGLLYDAGAGAIMRQGKPLPLKPEQAALFGPLIPGRAEEFVRGRLEAAGKRGELGYYDYEELSIAANATGLKPDTLRLHHPLVRTMEIPEVLSIKSQGGILEQSGAIECVICLRQADEPDLGGGVFVVVTAATEYSRYILATKGCISSQNEYASLIYRPYHLCGVETAMSILCAGLLGLPTGATEYKPRFDVVGRTNKDKRAGEVWTLEDLDDQIQPAAAIGPVAPLPSQMVYDLKVARDVHAGELVTGNMVVEPQGSPLWALRREQDKVLLQVNKPVYRKTEEK